MRCRALGAFGGQDVGEFNDIDKLTMFADYRVPQLLRSSGVLVYSQALSEKSLFVCFVFSPLLCCHMVLQLVFHFLFGMNENKNKRTTVDTKQDICAGTEEEVELRAATIQAVDRLCRQEACRRASLFSVELDWLLWCEGEELHAAGKLQPHHRTRTIFY